MERPLKSFHPEGIFLHLPKESPICHSSKGNRRIFLYQQTKGEQDLKNIAAKIKYLTVTLCLLLGPLLVIPHLDSEAQAPRATSGILDLSAWNFSSKDTAPLNGEWEFYWDQLLTPGDFANDSSSKKPVLTGYVNVPHLWQGCVNGTEIHSQGSATYRLMIKTPSDQHSFGIKTEIIRVTSRLFVNGLPLAAQRQP